MKKDIEEKERIMILAEKIKLLFGFCVDLIPDKDLLKRTLELSEDRHSRGLGMAVIFEAFGQDWEAIENETKIKKERAEALYNLIECLDKTEKTRLEFSEKQKDKPTCLSQLKQALGMF